MFWKMPSSCRLVEMIALLSLHSFLPSLPSPGARAREGGEDGTGRGCGREREGQGEETAWVELQLQPPWGSPGEGSPSCPWRALSWLLQDLEGGGLSPPASPTRHPSPY